MDFGLFAAGETGSTPTPHPASYQPPGWECRIGVQQIDQRLRRVLKPLVFSPIVTVNIFAIYQDYRLSDGC